MTQTIVRSTRGLVPGDVVDRMQPGGSFQERPFRIEEIETGFLSHRGGLYPVYYLSGTEIPQDHSKAIRLVKIAVTEGVPWCITRDAEQ